MIADIYPTEMLGTMMSYTTSASTAGMMMGPPIGGILYSSISPEAPYIFCSALAGFDFLLRLWVRPERAVKYSRIAEEEEEGCGSDGDEQDPLLPNNVETSATIDSEDILQDPSSTSQTQTTNIISSTTTNTSISMINLLQDFQFFVTFLSICIEAGTYSGVEFILSIHLSRHFHYTPFEIGLMFMALVLPDVLSAILIGPISDRYGRKNISALGMILLGVSLILLPFTDTKPAIAGALVLQGIGSAIAVTPNSPEMAEILERMNSKDYGQVYALYNVAYSIGMLVGPTVAGGLYDGFGFMVCMLAFAIGMFLWTPVMLTAWIVGTQKSISGDISHQKN